LFDLESIPSNVIARFMRATHFLFQMGHPDRAVPRDRAMTSFVVRKIKD
jgi:hypothetical protein